MKRLFLIAVSLLSISQSYSQVIKESDKVKLNRFFLNQLGGNQKEFKESKRIDLSDIESATNAVWNEWIEANNDFPEQKFNTFGKLENRIVDAWDIPQNLEPDAKWLYFMGYKGEQPQSGYPLYLYLHGSGPKDKEWQTGHKLAMMFNDAPSVYVIPQIPSEKRYRWWHKSKQFEIEKLIRLSFIDKKIDPNKLYIFGISEGGYGSQRLASFYADYLAGAGPMAGGEPLRNAPVENLRNTAFSFLTGEKDLMFGRDQLTLITGRELKKWQEKYPNSFVHRVELQEGRGHGIDYTPTTEWLKDKVRNPHPKGVIWENFAMDGVYRKGFYNIAVIERSNTDNNTPTRYIMEIDNNNITLNVDLVSYNVTKRNRWNIEMEYNKEYTPATKGKVTIYLNNKLVDLNREVTVTVNGKRVYKGVVKPNLKHMANSCAIFFDPERVYPAAIEVEI